MLVFCKKAFLLFCLGYIQIFSSFSFLSLISSFSISVFLNVFICAFSIHLCHFRHEGKEFHLGRNRKSYRLSQRSRTRKDLCRLVGLLYPHLCELRELFWDTALVLVTLLFDDALFVFWVFGGALFAVQVDPFKKGLVKNKVRKSGNVQFLAGFNFFYRSIIGFQKRLCLCEASAILERLDCRAR